MKCWESPPVKKTLHFIWRCQVFLTPLYHINYKITMTTDNQKKKESESVRIYKEKKTRVKEVKRALAVRERRDVSDTSLIDEILEEGLTKRERKLGIA